MNFCDADIENMQPKASPYKRGMGKGLQLHIKPNGRKHWKMKYRFNNKEQCLSLGEYPIISLEAAQMKVIAAKKLLFDAICPASEKQKRKKQYV